MPLSINRPSIVWFDARKTRHVLDVIKRLYRVTITPEVSKIPHLRDIFSWLRVHWRSVRYRWWFRTHRSLFTVECAIYSLHFSKREIVTATTSYMATAPGALDLKVYIVKWLLYSRNLCKTQFRIMDVHRLDLACIQSGQFIRFKCPIWFIADCGWYWIR